MLPVEQRFALREFERQQYPAADLSCIFQRLQARSELRPVVSPEVGMGSSGGNHEVVIGNLVALLEANAPALEVEADYIADQHLHILLASHHAADRRCDVCGRQRSQSHLVQQRLEGVVILAVKNRNVDIRFGESQRGLEPAESAADNHNSWTIVLAVVCHNAY